MTSPGRHERRGRHEVCGASVGAVFWGYTCDLPVGHVGIHWADGMNFDVAGLDGAGRVVFREWTELRVIAL